MIMGGCLRRILTLALLLVLLAAAWLYRDRLREAWHAFRGTQPEVLLPTPELAERAAARLDSLERGQLDRIALSEVELQSLLQYRVAGLLPAFVDRPTVELEGDRLRLRGHVPVDKLPSVGELGDASAFLPDTSELTITGKLLPLEGGRVAIAVDEVTAARIPLPRRLFPGALRRLGRTDEPGLPGDAVAVRLPFGASAAYVRNDSLVLLRQAARR